LDSHGELCVHRREGGSGRGRSAIVNRRVVPRNPMSEIGKV
jgi:hypothetical protein